MKYNFELDLETDNSLSLIARQLKSGTIVLEFGPAYGRLTKYMKEQLSCDVRLVEIDPEAGAEAAKYGNDIVIDDIESYSWYERYRDIYFDFIIFADVLEHLRNPGRVLAKASELLKASGRILLSVPNMAHNSIIIDLMNDKFKYSSIGLLDDTHIHFFTRTSLEDMISECGLAVTKKMATYAPVGTIEIQNSVRDVRGIEAGFWNTRRYGEVYQYVYEAAPEVTLVRDQADDTIDDIVSHYFFRCYYGEDMEFTQKDSIVREYGMISNQVTVALQTKPEWKYVRIDPINTNCILRIDEAKAICTEGDISIDLHWSNEAVHIGSYRWFKTKDPCMIYNLPENTREIVFSYFFENVDVDGETEEDACVYKMLTLMNDGIISMNNEIAELNEKYALINAEYDREKAKKEEFQNMFNAEHERANALQSWADGLRRKKLYRIYKYVKDFFKKKH